MKILVTTKTLSMQKIYAAFFFFLPGNMELSRNGQARNLCFTVISERETKEDLSGSDIIGKCRTTNPGVK